jgi:hypothetical protein
MTHLPGRNGSCVANPQLNGQLCHRDPKDFQKSLVSAAKVKTDTLSYRNAYRYYAANDHNIISFSMPAVTSLGRSRYCYYCLLQQRTLERCQEKEKTMNNVRRIRRRRKRKEEEEGEGEEEEEEAEEEEEERGGKRSFLFLLLLILPLITDGHTVLRRRPVCIRKYVFLSDFIILPMRE